MWSTFITLFVRVVSVAAQQYNNDNALTGQCKQQKYGQLFSTHLASKGLFDKSFIEVWSPVFEFVPTQFVDIPLA